MYSKFLKNILILPSGFKESLSATEVAEAIKKGVAKALPQANITAIPIPDGGEDTAYILSQLTNGKIIPYTITGPLGETISSYFAILGGSFQNVAVIEVAAAAGLKLIPLDRRNPTLTTSYGVGELIQAAIQQGATRIIIGCGDSGISDGGIGALQALGVKVTNNTYQDMPLGAQYLDQVAYIDYSQLLRAVRDAQVEIILALNPFNILCGSRGVAPVFAPQKGATPQQVQILANGLQHWAGQLKHHHLHPNNNFDFAYGLGTGASGGLGAGLAAIGAKLCPRFEVFLSQDLLGYDIDAQIQQADLIITAEGTIDCQTLRGKVPAEIAERAAKYNKPVVALAGTLANDADCVYDIGINAMSSIIPSPMSLQHALDESEYLLIQASERLIKSVLLGMKIAHQKTVIV